MALMVWTDEKFSVGVDLIDQQHKKLVEMINTLHDARLEGTGADAVGAVIKELIDYTRYHFRTEEQLMRTYGFPDYARHKLQHDALSRQVLALLNDFVSGRRTVTLQLSMFLKEWLTDHILGTDQDLGAFLHSKGIGSPVLAAEI